jgi:hypothetical protein
MVHKFSTFLTFVVSGYQLITCYEVMRHLDEPTVH